MHILWLKKIAYQGQHSAFTDLCLYRQHLFGCFRRALNHVSHDGVICIFKSDLAGNTKLVSRITLYGCDIRDPKLSVRPDGKLMLIAYVNFYDEKDRLSSGRNLCWVSQDGLSWSSPRQFGEVFWWLWRVRWQHKQAYGFAYNRGANAVDWYAGDPLRTFNKLTPRAFCLHKHGKAYPNESDIVFDQQHCFALLRRDADSYSAQLGCSRQPYKQWQWRDLGVYIGGPVMQLLTDDVAIVAGRIIHQQQLRTAVFTLQLSQATLSEPLLLPSAGDNSYPGLVITETAIYLSYYSSHEDNKSAIYLTKIARPTLPST
ncbi:MAG: hypothetical protein GW836_12170 [Paraglaciecola sp.]|nr:hypothetical protein [Paraglaciecola sp.]